MHPNGKTVALLTDRDVEDECGVELEQLTTGLKSSIEAMTDLSDEFASYDWGFLMIHAANAFYMINDVTAFYGMHVYYGHDAAGSYFTPTDDIPCWF